MAHEVFISYRKSISQREADLLKRQIDDCFGKEVAFIDKTGLEVGDVWPERLEKKLKKCKIIIVIIGKGWIGCKFTKTDEAKNIKEEQRRIDHPNDWVCREIEEGFKAKKAYPFFMGGAETGEVTPGAISNTKPTLRAFFEQVQGHTIPASQHDYEIEPILRAIEKKGLRRLTNRNLGSIKFDKTEVITEYHCYCCNRETHYNKLLEFYFKRENKTPHLHFFFPSLDDDKPESFITRFLMDEDAINGNYFLDNRQSNETIEKITQEELNAAICTKKIKNRIKNRVTNATHAPHGSWEAFLFRINLKHWKTHHIKAVLDYLNSEQLKKEFSNHKLLLFFWLNTTGLESQSARKWYNFFTKKNTDILPYIEKQLTDADNMIYLEALPPVGKDDVQNWFSNHCHNTQSYLNIINQQIFVAEDKLSMAKVEDILLKLIQSK